MPLDTDIICDIMSEEKRIKKLIAKFEQKQSEYDYADIKRLMEALGFELKKGRGSHMVFIHPIRLNIEPYTIPTVKGKRVKRWYVERDLKRLKNENFLDCFDDTEE